MLQYAWTLRTNAKGNIPIPKRQITVWFHLYEVPRVVKLTETEITVVVTRDWRERNKKLFSGHRGSVLQGENILDTGSTSMWIYFTWIYFTLINYILKFG